VRLLLHADELGVGAAVPSGHEVVVRAPPVCTTLCLCRGFDRKPA
jgi:hypothetical protein